MSDFLRMDIFIRCVAPPGLMTGSCQSGKSEWVAVAPEAAAGWSGQLPAGVTVNGHEKKDPA